MNRLSMYIAIMAFGVLFMLLYAVASTVADTQESVVAASDEPSQTDAKSLDDRVNALERRVTELEQRLKQSSMRFYPETQQWFQSPTDRVPFSGEKVPEQWVPFHHGGLTYYIMPLHADGPSDASLMSEYAQPLNDGEHD